MCFCDPSVSSSGKAEACARVLSRPASAVPSRPSSAARSLSSNGGTSSQLLSLSLSLSLSLCCLSPIFSRVWGTAVLKQCRKYERTGRTAEYVGVLSSMFVHARFKAYIRTHSIKAAASAAREARGWGAATLSAEDAPTRCPVKECMAVSRGHAFGLWMAGLGRRRKSTLLRQRECRRRTQTPRQSRRPPWQNSRPMATCWRGPGMLVFAFPDSLLCAIRVQFRGGFWGGSSRVDFQPL